MMPMRLNAESGTGGGAVTGLDGPVVDNPLLGEILRRTKGLSPEQIQAALDYQRANGVRFGEAIVKLGLAGSDDVMWALSQQFHYPYVAAAEADLDSELVVAKQPFADSVEIFRDLRTQLLLNGFGSPDDRSSLAMVSPNRGDGKTFIAANLAVAFGQLPGRTLIIDADLRSPRLHQIFNCPGSTGLVSVLNGRAEANVIRPVAALPNLYLLPVGATPPNPSELILKPAFMLLLNELSAKFDYVIVDTPAASHGSDARIVASRCGASLAVARKNRSKLPEMRHLLEQLGKTRIKMFGVVMNDY